MLRISDECVGCPPEIGCFGKSCQYKNVIRYYCDICETEEAGYCLDGMDVCEFCAKQMLTDEIFENYSLGEIAEMLHINLEKR